MGVVVSSLVVWSVCAAWWRGARAGVGVAGETQDVEGGVAQDGEDVWAGAGAGLAGVFTPGVRSRIPVRPVLDELMRSDPCGGVRRGWLGRRAG